MRDASSYFPSIFTEKERQFAAKYLADHRQDISHFDPEMLRAIGDVMIAVAIHDDDTSKGRYGNYLAIEVAKLTLADAMLKDIGLTVEPATLEERDEIKASKNGNNGYVYLMRNSRNGSTKIGFSKKPRFREKTLQSEEPEIEIICTIPGNIQKERAIQEKYSPARIRGEWFLLSAFDIDDIARDFAA